MLPKIQTHRVDSRDPRKSSVFDRFALGNRHLEGSDSEILGDEFLSILRAMKWLQNGPDEQRRNCVDSRSKKVDSIFRIYISKFPCWADLESMFSDCTETHQILLDTDKLQNKQIWANPKQLFCQPIGFISESNYSPIRAI